MPEKFVLNCLLCMHQQHSSGCISTLQVLPLPIEESEENIPMASNQDSSLNNIISSIVGVRSLVVLLNYRALLAKLTIFAYQAGFTSQTYSKPHWS